MNKYNAKKTIVNGITFDSKREADRYQELLLLERANVIIDLNLQQSFPIIKKSKYGKEIVYRADFTYLENGKLVVEDVKSPITKTPLYRLKKRLVAEIYDIEIEEIY